MVYMRNFEICKKSLPYSCGVVAYVAVVATFMQNVERIFGKTEPSIVTPMAFLLLLVTSVATMAVLVFGKPAMLYLDGKKKEGVATAICIILQIGFLTVLFLGITLILSRMSL